MKKSKKQILLPKFQKILEQIGENINLARKRRNLTTLQVSGRAGIDRSTLYHIEKGNSSVSREHTLMYLEYWVYRNGQFGAMPRKHLQLMEKMIKFTFPTALDQSLVVVIGHCTKLVTRCIQFYGTSKH